MPQVAVAVRQGAHRAWRCLVLAAVLAVCRHSEAMIILKGKCPSYLDNTIDFDFDRFIGKRWYIVMSDPFNSLTSNPTKCTSYLESWDRSTLSGLGYSTLLDITNSRDDSYSYFFNFPDFPKAHYNITLPINGVNRTGDSYVLATDYETFTANYNCAQIGEYKYELSEIFTRCPVPDPKHIAKGMAALERVGINTKNMAYLPQTCGILDESICPSACQCGKQD